MNMGVMIQVWKQWNFDKPTSYITFDRVGSRFGLSPMEIFSGTKQPYPKMVNLHVWGCPVYVLDPVLQDGRQIPKWNPRARRVKFVKQSGKHSSRIEEVLNLDTTSILSQ